MAGSPPPALLALDAAPAVEVAATPLLPGLLLLDNDDPRDVDPLTAAELAPELLATMVLVDVAAPLLASAVLLDGAVSSYSR